MNETRKYSELIQIPTFEERYNYLRIGGAVGKDTFGFHRYLNQRFYSSSEWKRFRRDIIVRDNGRDLAFDDDLYEIRGRIIIHHLNPISKDDISTSNMDVLLNPENVVCVSHKTHEAIHYGKLALLESYARRFPGDTIPWR